jgi:putative component of toxin-antitoxin plasmid stabilization module
MKPICEFWAVRTARSNVLVEWLSSDKALQARADASLHRLQHMVPPWPMPYYRPLGKGVGEVRFDSAKVEHRAYGYFSGRNFVAMLGRSGKKRQQQAIVLAKELKKQFDKNPPPTERYYV